MQALSWPSLALVAMLAAGYTALDAREASLPAAADASAVPANACVSVKTTGWKAWLDKMPGPGSTPTLHVLGKATTPTAGWKLALHRGILDKALPPTQRFDFIATAPTGPVPQVVTTQDVKAEVKPALPKYRAVTIFCDGKEIATMPVRIVT